MGRHHRWHGLLIAGAIALALAQTVQAAPLPLPGATATQVSVPGLPQVSVPGLPQVSVPSVTTPQVSVPGLPQVSVPSLTTPQVSVPSLPTVSRPRVPQVATSPLTNTPAPTRKQQLAQRPQAGSRAATVAPTASTRSSGASGSSRDKKAGAESRKRRARAIARGPSSKRLRRLLAPLDACVAALRPLQERVLVRRAGLRGFKPQTRRQLAKTLHTSRSRVARIERRALGNLRRAIRAGGCATPAPGAPAPGTDSASAAGLLVADRVAAPAQSGGGGSASDRVAVKGVAESKSSDSMVDSIANAGRGALATISEPARSFADDHPLAFTLVVLATLLCGALFVRETRRSV